jgi:hypothetical protein
MGTEHVTYTNVPNIVGLVILCTLFCLLHALRTNFFLQSCRILVFCVWNFLRNVWKITITLGPVLLRSFFLIEMVPAKREGNGKCFVAANWF